MPLYLIQRARATTKKIETPADLEGFGEMKDEEKDEVKSLISEFVTSKTPSKAKPKKKKEDDAKGSGQQLLLASPGAWHGVVYGENSIGLYTCNTLMYICKHVCVCVCV